MNIIDPLAESYADFYTSLNDSLLDAIEEETRNRHPKAHMLSGKVQGRLLESISCLMSPSRILEIGTFTGYSALCLVKGLAKAGVLHTIESSEEEAEWANTYFERSGRSEQIILHRGNALDIIPTLQETWDLVFIDADKVRYIDYYKLVLPRLKPGGIILADNVLFHGQVLEKEIKGKNAKAIHAFNEHVAKDGSVDKLMLTVRDGLLLIRKKN